MMRSLPDPLMALLSIFAPRFSTPVWSHVQVLRAGAILCQGPHPVAAVLRVMGLEGKHAFCKYHRVLSRARWSGWHGSKILLGRLVVLVRAAGVPLPWRNRRWALPFLSLLAASERANQPAGKPHKTTVEWAIRAVRIVSR